MMSGKRDFRPDVRRGPGIASPLDVIEGFLDEAVTRPDNALTCATVSLGTLIRWEDDAPLVATDKGDWDADTNTPTLTSGVGTEGDYYLVSEAGSTDLDSITDWDFGDALLFKDGEWIRLPYGTLCGSDQGEWDADTNTPTLSDLTGTKGHFYRVSVAGDFGLGDVTSWAVGDYLQHDGDVWVKRGPRFFETDIQVRLVNRDPDLTGAVDSYFQATKINGEFRLSYISCGIVRPH